MSHHETVRVNFARPIPVFPLHTATLLPHGIVQLHIFEPRYRQMVSDVLDGPGQIAMGVFDGSKWKQEYHGRPPLKPAVCIGQIVQHVHNEDGTYEILLQGLCRARIVREEPADETRLYRSALLTPLGDPSAEEEDLEEHREKLAQMLESAPLNDLKNAEGFAQYLRGDDVPAHVIVELLAYTFLTVEDPQKRYEFLAQPNAVDRAVMVESALEGLARLLTRAASQRQQDAPKGCSWN